MTEDRVSIVILNWNGVDTLAACVESVKNQTHPAIELWILDNASTDDSVNYIKEKYPDIHLTVFEENLGFARAHNYAMGKTDGAYYMPLNPDMILTPDYVAEMVKAAKSSNRTGSVMGKLLFMDNTGNRTEYIYSTGHLLTKSRSPSNRGYKKRDTGQYDELELVFAANGAAPLYRREMIEDVAIDGEYFCGDFFIYGDDHDLGWRAQLRRWDCLYTPYAVGYHVGFGSGGMRSFHVQVQFTRNRYLTLVRNDHPLHFLLDLPYILAYEIIWQFSRLLLSPRRLLAHWYGIAKAVSATPYTLKARAIIQKNAETESKSIRSFFSSQLW